MVWRIKSWSAGDAWGRSFWRINTPGMSSLMGLGNQKHSGHFAHIAKRNSMSRWPFKEAIPEGQTFVIYRGKTQAEKEGKYHKH
ncbi:MAG: hypothetical protein HQL19_07985 [Candidatus Omnitrophica bacterium]|nr:hypothetical protein [Candidatus Omnitrophota bacterium]